MRIAVAVALTACCILALGGPAEARRRHRVEAPPAAAPQRQPFEFYPEHVEGGVPGNLPFNNQIRKHTDPLNANGAR